MGNTYGYVRVSTREQNEDRQMAALNEMQVEEKNIYMDKQSGKDFDRPMYHRLLNMPLLDTRRGKDLMGTFLSDIVLQVLSFVAENERDCIRQRQKEGIEAAKQRGVRFGRPEEPLPDNFRNVSRQWISKEISGKEAARLCNMSKSSFYRRVGGRKRKR